MNDITANNDTEKQDPLLPLETLEDVRQRLNPFFERNPKSELTQMEMDDDDKEAIFKIDKPWGDPTLMILVPGKEDNIYDTLNNIILPERLSAVWHQDSKDLEVVWTSFPLKDDQKEIEGRKFTFKFNKRSFTCEFSKSSKKLMDIATFCFPITNPSETNFRNMQSFGTFARSRYRKSSKDYSDYKPLSFFIRKASLSEKQLISLIESLNFYLSYYDTRSPRVLIHDVHGPVNPRTRYPHGSFPAVINGRQLDDTLASFWDAARQSNPMLRFIFFYRIIEYAAFHYLDVNVRAKLRKALANPSIGHDLDRATKDVLSCLEGFRSDEVPRFNSLLQNSVNPSIVWKEIESNKSIFSEPFRFDGGFQLKTPIISKDETERTFIGGGIVKFADAIRQIRNVLVHGRDQNTSTAITPSPKNLRHLSAWGNAVAAAAAEVVLYGNNP